MQIAPEDFTFYEQDWFDFATSLPQLIETILRDGFRQDGPSIVVWPSTKPYVQRIVYKGTKRIVALLWIRDHKPAEYLRVLPTGLVDCILLEEYITDKDDVILQDGEFVRTKVPTP
ncbi:hypothetical protein LCGC14_2657840 [marine sediment metagenome]|uniref:Uncharacterized protein n=1 Tax=marine sediment metagenome TaxID=412755 RepID=A0A0F9AF72_9ZZZZ